jgi:hypothetical protein
MHTPVLDAGGQATVLYLSFHVRDLLKGVGGFHVQMYQEERVNDFWEVVTSLNLCSNTHLV